MVNRRRPRNQVYRYLRALVFACLSMFAEKNPVRAIAVEAPFVFSMSRIIVGAFAIAMLRQITTVGIAGWPEATLCIALVFAIPVLSALSRVSSHEVLEFGKTIVARFGIGDVRVVGTLTSREPDARTDDERGTFADREAV